MEKKLYLISNTGCDDTTWGLAELTDQEFTRLCRIISDLNKNSTYGCQPMIELYYMKPEDVRPLTEEEIGIDDPWDDGYIEKYKILYLNGKPYTLVDRWASLYSSFEQAFPYKF